MFVKMQKKKNTCLQYKVVTSFTRKITYSITNYYIKFKCLLLV